MSVTTPTPRIAPSVMQPAEAPDATSAPRVMRLPIDPWLTLAVLGLGICSVVTLASVTKTLIPGDPRYYVNRQAIYLIAGVVAMVLMASLDYGRLRRHGRALYVALVLSLLAVRALGHAANGSQRAINFPFFAFQASELGKVLLIVALASFVVERYRHVRERKTTAQVMLAGLLAAMLVIVQPDVGSGLVFIVIAFAVLFVAGVPAKHLIALVAIGAASIALVLGAAPAMGVHLLKPYQEERLTAFLHPSTDSQKQGYQQEESKIAIGSGQKTGRGVNATQTTLNFVPEDDTDFIFAAVGERWGFIGAALVLSLYALVIWRLLRILTMSKDLFGAVIAGGVVAAILFQVFINVGMAIGISPITGITLPLVSYGGSSVIATLLALGLAQSIYAQARAAQAQKGRAAVGPRA
jgi:rod shape determining protein RodA